MGNRRAKEGVPIAGELENIGFGKVDKPENCSDQADDCFAVGCSARWKGELCCQIAVLAGKEYNAKTHGVKGQGYGSPHGQVSLEFSGGLAQDFTDTQPQLKGLLILLVKVTGSMSKTELEDH